MPEINNPRPLVPSELSELNLHIHDEIFFYYLHDLTQFLTLTSDTDVEALAYHKLGPEFIERLRDPNFQSPCPKECFPLETFFPLYLFRFPGRFPLSGSCCQNRNSSICSRRSVVRRCQQTLENALPESGLAESEITEYLQAQNPDCILSHRSVGLQALRQLGDNTPLFEIREQRVYSIPLQSVDVTKWQKAKSQRSRKQPRGLSAFD